MTASLLTHSLDLLSVESCVGYRPRLPIASRLQRPVHKTCAAKCRDRGSTKSSVGVIELSQLWKELLEMLPHGIIVLSRQLQPVYWNQKAKQLCQMLTTTEFSDEQLPLPVSEACRDLMRDHQRTNSSSTLMVECQTSTGHLVRVSARPLDVSNLTKGTLNLTSITADAIAKPTPGFIVVFIENCNEIIQQEAKIQQQKFDLTEREAEVWMLLQQELTYQDIAHKLQISLNTVKTHVKNIYGKRRTCQSKEKFWC